jgi:ABC-type multidrug transport system ATPase subunit
MGRNGPAELRSVITRVGSIVETPAFTPRMSGRRNLELLGAIDGIGGRRVGEALDQVGLSDRADDRVRTYSLGMKQRLGIAAALLKEPAVLILDEPANGLDPAGIKEVRELLRRLGAEGRTVFVSSHILSEVQQIADRVAIIARGVSRTGGSGTSWRRASHLASSSARRSSRRRSGSFRRRASYRRATATFSASRSSRARLRPSHASWPPAAYLSRSSARWRRTSRPSS